MRNRSSYSHDNVRYLLRYALLGLLVVIVSACHRGANEIPVGYEGVFNDPARASTAARVDYPIVVTNPAKFNTFRVTKNGERTWFWEIEKFWGDQQSWWNWSPTWYRIILTMDGMEKPICDTQWQANSNEPQEIYCKFDAKDYLYRPLLAILFYKMGGDEKNPPLDDDLTVGVVPRFYYYVPKP